MKNINNCTKINSITFRYKNKGLTFEVSQSGTVRLY